MSDSDIKAGERWQLEIAKQLHNSDFGIICVTRENLNSHWLLFESGALATSVTDSNVIPLMYDLQYSELQSPLTQFQSNAFNKRGVENIINAINSSYSEINPKLISTSTRRFHELWASWENAIAKIPMQELDPAADRPEIGMLEHVVQGMEELGASLKQESKRKREFFYPTVVSASQHFWDSKYKEPLVLLVLASFFRESVPWLYEILVDTYSDIKRGNYEQRLRAIGCLRMIVEDSLHQKNRERICEQSELSPEVFQEAQLYLEQYLKYMERNLG